MLILVGVLALLAFAVSVWAIAAGEKNTDDQELRDKGELSYDYHEKGK